MTASTRPAAPPRARIDEFYARVPVGKAAAKSAAQLAAELGLAASQAQATESAKRTIRLLADQAVDAGLLLVADNAGYFVPAEYAEMEEAMARMASQEALMAERRRRVQALADARFHGTTPRLI